MTWQEQLIALILQKRQEEEENIIEEMNRICYGEDKDETS